MTPMAAGRVRDLAIYIAIGVTIVLAITWGSMHSAQSGAEVFGKWGGLAADTLIVFGYTIRYNKFYWKRVSFWMAFAALLVAHLVLFILIFKWVSEWRISWWIVVVPFEYLAVASALVLFGYRRHGRWGMS